MQRFRLAIGFLILLILVVSVGWLALIGVRGFTGYISTIPKELGAPIIAAAATVFVATLTVVLGKYFERKKELDALYRDKKTEVYDEFLKKFFEVYFSSGENVGEHDLILFFQDFSRKLVLWGGPDVIEAFVAWKDHLAKGLPDAKSIFLTEDFLLAVRKDLRHTNKGIRRGLFARMFIQNSALFLAMSAKNPNLKLEDMAAIEKLLASAETTKEAPPST
ncbi:hypothetical protein [Pigmentiphaga litoralis]|uniref:Uncharacterized protein n=1 Tax=Pigmentiphaga litoralis TaxID=516702 RepID=A0A7Y9LMS8_9BURK|nr:hypothetical protein [Pigmentiphaga litoralis]NYE26124.1 hypothetical protein [Pigmentiphaga litoralis]NYE85244.1 hypothetical protein [Pigmentiphaga litoralis]